MVHGPGNVWCGGNAPAGWFPRTDSLWATLPGYCFLVLCLLVFVSAQAEAGSSPGRLAPLLGVPAFCVSWLYRTRDSGGS